MAFSLAGAYMAIKAGREGKELSPAFEPSSRLPGGAGAGSVGSSGSLLRRVGIYVMLR